VTVTSRPGLFPLCLGHERGDETFADSHGS
jgi:hypothetical protein